MKKQNNNEPVNTKKPLINHHPSEKYSNIKLNGRIMDDITSNKSTDKCKISIEDDSFAP